MEYIPKYSCNRAFHSFVATIQRFENFTAVVEFTFKSSYMWISKFWNQIHVTYFGSNMETVSR